MRVVFDTNTVLSALLFASGRPAWLPILWVRNTITPLVSRETSIELIRVLAYPKFKLSAEEIQAVLNAYLPYAEIIIVPAETASNTPICRDQNDQMFIDLAVVGHAAVLVSGDKDLLDLAFQTSFVIESPTQFKLRFD